jgi:hypothetical protein
MSYFITIPVWLFIVELVLTSLCTLLLTYIYSLYKKGHRKYGESIIKRLSAEVSPEFHAEVKAFCLTIKMSMKDFIIESVRSHIDALKKHMDRTYVYDEEEKS